jgi:outer membrane protein OmpA-like peptidoglycan-associated protein
LLCGVFYLNSTSVFGMLPSGSFAVSGLQSGCSARALAMGSAYTGMAEGISAVFWNPAGLGALNGGEVSFHHASNFGGSIQEAAVFGMRTGEAGGFAFSLNYMDSGLFERRDIFGSLLSGQNTASEMGAVLGWGSEIFRYFFAGAAIKAGKKSIADNDYNFFAGDLGLLWKPDTFFSMGLTYFNLGGKIMDNYLMSGLRAGAAYRLNAGKDNRLTIAAACEAQPSGQYRISAGIENTGYSVLSVRLGYVYNFTNNRLEGFYGFTAGLGITAGNLSVDYAFIPFGDLGSSHRVSLSFAMPDPELKKIYLPKTDRRVMTFETAHFDHNSYELKSETITLLLKNIKILKENPKTEIRITGHTSKSGGKSYNLLLSEKRALTIRNYLIREGGIPIERIFIIGYGDAHPAVFEADPGQVNSDAAKMNRRGLFEIIKQ